MTDKKYPKRMCVSCRIRRNKQDLFRIVKDFDTGNVNFDINGSSMGRGAYVCKEKRCVEKCIKTSALNRTFKKNVPLEVYQSLNNNLLQNNGGDCV